LNAIALPARSIRVNLAAAHEAVTRAGFLGGVGCLALHFVLASTILIPV